MDPVITAAAVLCAEGGPAIARIEHRVRQRWPEAPDRIGRMDRASIHQLIIAHRLVASTGLSAIERETAGVVLGTALGCAEANESFHRGLVHEGLEGSSAMLFAQTIPSAPVGEVGIAFGMRGHAVTVMAGRCSGVAALAEARRAIRLGRCKTVLVLAGDIVGPDRIAVLKAIPGRIFTEAAVGLVLEDPTTARSGGRSVRAIVGDVHLGRSQGAAHAASHQVGPDWLGASGLIELVGWLDSDSPTFAMEVLDPGGLRGMIVARRASD